jgi:4-hydroxy-2-oxoheptanedioate aldolase
MQIPRNAFKASLKEGRQQIGIWCSIPGWGHAELLATCGFDWMLIDTEHSPVDLMTVQAMLQAAAPYPTHAAVRPGSLDPVEIKRLLDIGAQTILVPYVQSSDEARAAVAAVRYPPHGIRGVAGITRASRYGFAADYFEKAGEEICLLVQVETVRALDQIESIAAVDGVDGLFIGPSDLAASMGYPGLPGHPDVKAAVIDGVRRIVAAGRPAGILSLDPSLLDEAVAAGTTFTAVDVDAAILLRGMKTSIATVSISGTFAEKLKPPSPPPGSTGSRSSSRISSPRTLARARWADGARPRAGRSPCSSRSAISKACPNPTAPRLRPRRAQVRPDEPAGHRSGAGLLLGPSGGHGRDRPDGRRFPPIWAIWPRARRARGVRGAGLGPPRQRPPRRLGGGAPRRSPASG